MMRSYYIYWDSADFDEFVWEFTFPLYCSYEPDFHNLRTLDIEHGRKNIFTSICQIQLELWPSKKC